VQLDALAVRLRPRTPLEAADLGVRLCQATARSIYSCYALAAVPVMTLAFGLFEVNSWLPGLLIWWAKPWLDRTILFVLSRAAFGAATSPADVWRAQREVWWRQFLFTWTIRRLSPWRSLTGPVYQLEGFSVFKGRDRVRQIRSRAMGAALMMTSVFSLVENALSVALLSLVFWFAPAGSELPIDELFAGEAPMFVVLLTIGYAIAVLFLEPFYVAAGFGMYLNRRAELEAWDIEQEFRRAFAPGRPSKAALVGALLLAACLPVSAGQREPAAAGATPDRVEIAGAIDAVKADPNLATERTIKTLRWKQPSSKPSDTPWRLAWIAGLFAWLGESARVLVWCAAAGLAGLLAVYLTRIARTRLGHDANEGAFPVPTHVRDMDIRPETLPDDIGAAARVLWERGEQRAALALLYRGMLSRLAHVHGVPIRDSSTEGDCLALATARLPRERSEYLSRLVRVWQRFGYGREAVDTAAVCRLCDEFASALRPVALVAPREGTV
jgi:Domain of unknown function (DUF4129)